MPQVLGSRAGPLGGLKSWRPAVIGTTLVLLPWNNCAESQADCLCPSGRAGLPAQLG